MFLFRKHQERSTDATHIRHNIPLGQSEMQSCHLILTEIEQLVDQIQQTLRIAVHQLQLAMQFSSVISFIILSIGDIISVSGVRNSWLTFVKSGISSGSTPPSSSHLPLSGGF